MRGLTVFLLIFISYNFGEIAGDKSKVEKWLSMKIEDVDEQCKSAGKEKLDRKVLSKYYQGINDYGGNEKLEGSSDFDYFLNYTYDTMMVENMKDVIRSVQNCVNDENRLQPEDSIAVMKHVLQMHAKKILAIGVISEQDSKNCKSTNKLETCGKRYDKIFRNGPGTNLSLIQLLIPSYMEVSTCAEALPAERCVMKYLRDCESGIQKYFQVAFTPSENIDAICENFLHDVVSDTDDVNEDTTATDNSDKLSVKGDESKVDEWLNMKIGDVNEQCKSVGENAIQRKHLSEFYYHLDDYITSDKNENSNEFDYYLNAIYKPEMIASLKGVIKSVQDCLEENNRLEAGDIIQVMDRVLTSHANRILAMSRTIEKDIDLCETISDNSKEKCSKNHGHLIRKGFNDSLTIIQILVPSFVTVSSCTEALPLEECFMKYFSTCNSNAKRFFQIILTPSQNTNGVCENFRQETDNFLEEGNNDILQDEDFLRKLFHV